MTYAIPAATYQPPQMIVQERMHEIRRPHIVERIVEVPKPEMRHVYREAEPVIRHEEQIIEVPQVVYEERIIHVPRKEIQERLIEVPKIEWVETIEYDDRIEYREVCVDKIVEVPEVEYQVRNVEQLVPQQYIEEYFQDNYKEFPMTQVQEVSRTEYAPVRHAAQQVFSAPQATMVAPQVRMVSAPPQVMVNAPLQVAPPQPHGGQWVWQQEARPV
jgi:hypothetical protein